MSEVFEAQYPGRCTVCDEWFEKGTEIRMSPAGARHDRCPEGFTPLTPREVCPRCFMEKALSGACECDQ